RARPRVGDRALEAISDLDAEVRSGRRTLVRDEQDDESAIAQRITGLPGGSDPPRASDVEGRFLDRPPAEGRQRHPRDGGGGFGWQRLRAVLQRLKSLRGKKMCRIEDEYVCRIWYTRHISRDRRRVLSGRNRRHAHEETDRHQPTANRTHPGLRRTLLDLT